MYILVILNLDQYQILCSIDWSCIYARIRNKLSHDKKNLGLNLFDYSTLKIVCKRCKLLSKLEIEKTQLVLDSFG